MSLAKLTSISTQTLSLLLERQRLHTLPSFSPTPLDLHAAAATTKSTSLHLPQITKNLNRMRAGIVELEAKEGRSEAVVLLRSQFQRMRGMLGEESTVESLEVEQEAVQSSSSPSQLQLPPTPSPPTSLAPTPPSKLPAKDSEPLYSPYTDDPEAGHHEPGIMLQTQRQLMNEQDGHLDRLSHSLNRQHHISLQINDELDVHSGLLEELDTDLDHTESRLSGARRRLDRVARGAANNGSTVTIGLLILVLLVLIIIFKT
ncbi:Syntaxin-61 [Hypsizygus marmoreus]|uniref:Syntaxin-61 n=1 Tax=Hypsizygus marmoreus TaxID=39966 RepID=A0A369K247_HYPMA|nr:Syntaxin-61 [Hypsizygus marmoreus]